MGAKVNRYMRMWYVLLLILPATVSSAQVPSVHMLKYLSSDRDSVFIYRTMKLQSLFPSYEQASIYLEKLPSFLAGNGFMAASIDSAVATDSQTVVHLYFGKQYNGARIEVQPQDRNTLQLAGISPQLFNELVSFTRFSAAQQKLLDYFENNGHPFSQVGLDSVVIYDSTIAARLVINKGITYRIDSIRMMGSARISQNFIQRYLNIERGSLYKREALTNINQRLLELPYLQQIQPWDVTMLNTGSLVNLYLQPRRSNQINVLAGFLPANQQLGGKLLLTVDANLLLQNAFGTGERIGLVWQQIQPKSPKLNLQYTQPYIFNSSFGVDFQFELFKRDSSFLNLNGQVGLVYMISPRKNIKLVLQSQLTNVLDVDTFRVKQFKQLPAVADVRSLNIGVDYDFNSTDYRFNPRKGAEFNLYAGVGQKTVRKNTTVTQIKDPAFDYNRLYDTIQLKTYQVRMRLRAAKYFPLGKVSVLKTGLQAGWFQSPSTFRNELFQVGGYRLLRGFDEEAIFASSYAVATIEYRLLMGLNSNFFAFSDVGWSSNTITKLANNYLGAGIGLSRETKSGIFNITYAVGKRNDLNFDIRQSKIHFGYVSIF